MIFWLHIKMITCDNIEWMFAILILLSNITYHISAYFIRKIKKFWNDKNFWKLAHGHLKHSTNTSKNDSDSPSYLVWILWSTDLTCKQLFCNETIQMLSGHQFRLVHKFVTTIESWKWHICLNIFPTFNIA